jgi:glycosyltransferase involved in cell wall biosynthesis
MRVAFFAHTSRLYGASRSLLDLLDGLSGHGLEPRVVCAVEGDLSVALRQRGIPTVVLPLWPWLAARPTPRWRSAALARLAQNLVGLPALLRQLRAWRIDLLYSNSSLLPSGALAAALLGKPHVWHLREFGWPDYGLRLDWGRASFAWWLRRSAAVIAVSEAVRQAVAGSLPTERVRVIPNGVGSAAQLERLRERAREQPPGPGGRFVLVGRLRPSKGQASAIRALALLAERCPSAHLTLVGDGDPAYLRHCRALAEALGVGRRVEFRGYLADPWPAYLAADAALMCSPWEAMGRVTAEAMAAGRPVVGFDNAGTAELIEHERTGLLYRGGPQALADSLARLIEDPTLAGRLGQQAGRAARQRFTTERCAGQVYAVLHAAAQA